MSRNKRPRYDAFSDFARPPENATQSGNEFPDLEAAQSDLLRPAGYDLENGELQPELVELLHPSQMLPDPFQPRVSPLPQQVRERFWSGEIDQYQAAREWLEIARSDPSGHGRRLAKLMQMGQSLEQNGQINPVTGHWEENIFRIETGEQRYWSAIINAVNKNAADEPLLRVVVTRQASRERQVIENRHFFAPSAVTMAREIASLLLEKLGIQPEGGLPVDGYEYFRQVLEINRLPNGVWEQIIPIMNLSRRRMAQIISVLRMPSELLDLADMYAVPDTTLRAIMDYPEEQWGSILFRAIESQYTAEEVQEQASLQEQSFLPERPAGPVQAGSKASPRQHVEPAILAFRGIRKFRKVIARSWSKDETVLGRVADEIYSESGESDARSTLGMLEELARELRVRLNGNM